MIRGIGVDLTPVARFQAVLARHPERLEARLFTERERAYCRRRAHAVEHLAARFAAKEAALKALGVPSGLSWHELEVVSLDGSAPRLELHGQASRAAALLGVVRVHLTLTHAGGQALAMVVAEG